MTEIPPPEYTLPGECAWCQKEKETLLICYLNHKPINMCVSCVYDKVTVEERAAIIQMLNDRFLEELDS